MSQWQAQQDEWQPLSSKPYPNDGFAPGPSQPYAQTYAPPLPGYGDSKSPYEGDRFKPKKKINDPIFLILFLATVLGFGAVSGIVVDQWIKEDGLGGGIGGNNTGDSVTLNQHTVILLLLVTAASLIISFFWLLLARMFTKAIMHITLVLSVLLNIAVAVFFWIEKFYVGAIVFTVIGLISIMAYFGYRRRIPFASLLLQVVLDVSKHHWSVYITAFISLIIQAALSVWFVFTAIATYEKYTPGNPSCNEGTSCSDGKVIGLIIFEVFSYLWISQVIGNVALATLAGGPYGCWYYFGPKGYGEMPKWPTLSAFGRAASLSLGSIAFGSLIVTILELIRLVLNSVRQNAAQDGNPCVAILACCAECFVGCLESLMEYFNRYAYIEIALYGKPYIAAAKDTFRLFRDRGITAIVNDSLVGMMITWGAYAVGLISALLAYLYLHFTHPAYNADGQYTVPVLVFAFIVGMQFCLTLGAAIEAGVSTIFVGLGEDPQVLAMRAPELFEMVRQTYPEVVIGV